MKCPKCNSNQLTKDGIVRGLQRHKCKDCGFRHTVERRSGTGSDAEKRLALALYLEGLGFRSIGRILKYSQVAIMNWIREFGESCQPLQQTEPIEVAELDELHSYIGSKKTLVGCGLLWIGNKKSMRTLLLATGARRQVKGSGKELGNNAEEES
jgi:transposase